MFMRRWISNLRHLILVLFTSVKRSTVIFHNTPNAINSLKNHRTCTVLIEGTNPDARTSSTVQLAKRRDVAHAGTRCTTNAQHDSHTMHNTTPTHAHTPTHTCTCTRHIKEPRVGSTPTLTNLVMLTRKETVVCLH
jgi:hypothetical protein